ncbi:hypothetical protein ACWEF6_02710 [Amycolatopsis sp. NPDC004772]
MPDRAAFNPQLHGALTAAQMAPAARDGLTHHTTTVQRTAAACGAPGATRLARDWALVDCPDCRTTPTPTAAPSGLYPAGYRFTIHGKVHTVIGHREVGYGQVGHEIDCEGVTCWVATEYIREYGTSVK